MAEKRRYIDVWVVETNTVYKEVPYTVVADWVQQGRVLDNDKLRPSGTSEWFSVGTMPAFAAYLPKTEPFRAEDQAEALERVEVDFAWRPARGDEDDDPDMIPLIDVSLVLLIFFMMTATVASSAGLINTPVARAGFEFNSEINKIWVGIDLGSDNEPIYSLGTATGAADKNDQGLSESELLQHLRGRLDRSQRVDVTVRAHQRLPYEVVRRLTEAVEGFRAQGLVGKVYAEVREGE
jgi:biopolymer transport protein ExbD